MLRASVLQLTCSCTCSDFPLVAAVAFLPFGLQLFVVRSDQTDLLLGCVLGDEASQPRASPLLTLPHLTPSVSLPRTVMAKMLGLALLAAATIQQ